MTIPRYVTYSMFESGKKWTVRVRRPIFRLGTFSILEPRYNNSNVKVLIFNIHFLQFWWRNRSLPKSLIWSIGQKFAMLSLVKLKMELFLVLNSSSNQLIIIWSLVSKIVLLTRNIIFKQLLSIRKLSSRLEFRANMVSITQTKPSFRICISFRTL